MRVNARVATVLAFAAVLSWLAVLTPGAGAATPGRRLSALRGASVPVPLPRQPLHPA